MSLALLPLATPAIAGAAFVPPVNGNYAEAASLRIMDLKPRAGSRSAVARVVIPAAGSVHITPTRDVAGSAHATYVRRLDRAGVISVNVKLRERVARSLERAGRARVTVALTYTAVNGVRAYDTAQLTVAR
jgi:hypothetical protein